MSDQDEAKTKEATRRRIQSELVKRGLIRHGRGVEDEVVDRDSEAFVEPLAASAAPELLGNPQFDGRRLKASVGVHVSGPGPYGYRRVLARGDGEANLAIDPVEAEVVKKIFAGYIRLKSMKKLEALLNGFAGEPAVKTRRGNVWARAGLAWILKNQAYVGRIKYGEIEVMGLHEPIISRPMFNHAQALMRANDKHGEGRRGKKEA